MSDRARGSQRVEQQDNYQYTGETGNERVNRRTEQTERRRGNGGCCDGGGCCCRAREEVYTDSPKDRARRHAEARARMEALTAGENYTNYGDRQATFHRRPSRQDRVADPDYALRQAGRLNSVYGLDPEQQDYARRIANRNGINIEPYGAEYQRGNQYYDERAEARHDWRRNDSRFGRGGRFDIGVGDGNVQVRVGIGNRGYDDDYYYRNQRYDSDYGRYRRGGDYYDEWSSRRRNDDYYYNRGRYPWDERNPMDDYYRYGQYGRYGNYGRYGRDGVYFGIGRDGQLYGGFSKDGISIGVGSNNGRYNRYDYNRDYGYYDGYQQYDQRYAMRHGGAGMILNQVLGGVLRF